MISGTEPANAAVVACDTPATTRPHAARVGAWALADWLIPLALALVTFAVFSPALSNNFVDWDDQINLTGNEEYRRSEEHTSELQSPCNLVCRLLLEKKKKILKNT